MNYIIKNNPTVSVITSAKPNPIYFLNLFTSKPNQVASIVLPTDDCSKLLSIFSRFKLTSSALVPMVLKLNHYWHNNHQKWICRFVKLSPLYHLWCCDCSFSIGKEFTIYTYWLKENAITFTVPSTWAYRYLSVTDI